MRRWCILFLTLAVPLVGWAQSGLYNVLDWKANTTLNSYLIQELHQQYAPRHAELAEATATATDAGTLAYRDSVRVRFRRLLGPLPATRTPLRAQVTGRLARPGFHIEKIIYESTPHHHVTANLYVPDGQGKRPAVLLPCGHEAEGKAAVSYQKTAMLFASHGFVVLVPDPVSQGERMQLTDAAGKPLTRGGTTEHTLLNAQANLLGRTLAAAELWDNVRSLDYLSTRPEVDTARLGCLGNSGGATQTAYLMAYDKRLKVAALCSYVAAGERNLELTGPADGCVMLPGAGAARLDIGDWLIAFVPNPMLVLAGRYDFVDYSSIETAYTEACSADTTLNDWAQEVVRLFKYDDGHGISEPKREEAVSWFQHWLFHEETVMEEPLSVASVQELQCTTTGQVNTEFKNEETLAATYQRLALGLSKDRRRLTIIESVQRQLGLTFQKLHRIDVVPEMAWLYLKENVEIEHRDTLQRAGRSFQKLILRQHHGPPMPALWLHSNRKPTVSRVAICFADKGKATLADSAAFLTRLLTDYDAVLLVDLRGQGETADPASFNDPKYYNREYRPALLSLHLGEPLLAQRVRDIIRAVDFIGTGIQSKDNEAQQAVNAIAYHEAIEKVVEGYKAGAAVPAAPIDVYAIGHSSALAAVHAAIIDPRIRQVRLTERPLSYQQLLAQPTTKDVYSDVLPGVLQHYDVPDLVRALGDRLKTDQ